MVDFPKLSHRLVALIRSDGIETAVDYCEARAPWLNRQLKSDARRNGPLSFWGRSRNIDEFAGDTIVPAEILDLLGAITSRRLSHKTPHAGLQHTYGYLFSTLETEFGFKRDRWLRSDIADAFGFEPMVLGPTPGSGTFLANVSAFAGQFAFRGRDEQIGRMLSQLKSLAAAEVLGLDIDSVHQVRVLESIERVWRGKSSSWQLQTDLVDRGRISILIYSVKNLASGRHEMVTLFPIQAEMKADLLDRAASAQLEDIRLRFNGYVPGLVGHDFSGSVTTWEF